MVILTRPSKAADLSLVFDSWLNSWRTSKFAGCIPNHKYFELQRGLIEDLFARGMRVVVAHPEGHPDLIMGWVAYEVKCRNIGAPLGSGGPWYSDHSVKLTPGDDAELSPVIHYLFVKDAYIDSDVAALLVQAVPGAQPGIVTHRQNLRLLRTWKHVPEVARRKLL